MNSNLVPIKNRTVKVNQLSEKSKKSFKTRLISSIFIVLFLLLTLVFSILSDTRWSWFPVSNIAVKEAFSFIGVFFMFIILIIGAIEVTHLNFYRNKLMYLVVIGSMVLATLGPSLIFIFAKFNYFNKEEIDYFYMMLATVLTISICVVLVNIFFFWLQGLLEFKKVFIHCSLIVLVPLFIIAWNYFSLFKGWTTLLLLYLITALTDVFAYICGMFFGKRKMSPFISPNKTIGGGIGGVIVTTVITIILIICLSFVPNEYNVLGNFFGIRFNYLSNWIEAKNSFAGSFFWWLCVVIIIPVLCLLSMAGDLSYSYIKRMYNIKDYSNLIPGHGGVLDRIDSLTFTFSAYFIFTMFISLFSSSVGIF